MIKVIVNNGSTSKKYSLYNDNNLEFSTHYESVEENFIKTEISKKDSKESEVGLGIFEKAFGDFIDTIIKKGYISSEEDVSKIGIRVVSPGSFFQENHKIDSKFLEILEDGKKLSPLHIVPVQREISEIMDKMPKIDLVAISDSSFHKSKPDYSNIYAYPKEITKDLDLYRFGYHGLSVSSVVEELKGKNSLKSKIIVCHLGGGSSITAVLDGKSIDNTMGYSPIEGVPMATRSGNTDPNTIFAIMEDKDYDNDEMRRFLYKECGFKGISGLTGDTRVILKESFSGNKDATLALDYYAYEIKKTIGAYATILGGVDSLVFTGTIGTRSADVRKRICDNLDFLNIEIDQSENKLTIKGDKNIKNDYSKVDVFVMETNEMSEMNRILDDIS